MASSRPVGVFDSGIGGLTVADAIMRQLPRESIVYFGDTARVPYGPKSPETVRRYCHEISRFLVAQDVKAIVVACNTATAHALPELQEEMRVPVLGVVEPGARAAVRATRNGHIGIIGTSGTILSRAYEDAIRDLAPDVRVTSRACPLLVPLVEEGWTEHPVTQEVAREYVVPLVQAGVDVLVLGCTHYPLIKKLLCRVAGPGVQLIDSAAETAAELGDLLRQHSIEAPPDAEPAHRFVASDDPLQFLQLGQRFLGNAIDSVEVHAFT